MTKPESVRIKIAIIILFSGALRLHKRSFQKLFTFVGGKGEGAIIKIRNQKFLISRSKFAFCQLGGKTLPRTFRVMYKRLTRFSIHG